MAGNLEHVFDWLATPQTLPQATGVHDSQRGPSKKGSLEREQNSPEESRNTAGYFSCVPSILINSFTLRCSPLYHTWEGHGGVSGDDPPRASSCCPFHKTPETGVSLRPLSLCQLQLESTERLTLIKGQEEDRETVGG